jgi:hypothetical protein
VPSASHLQTRRQWLIRSGALGAGWTLSGCERRSDISIFRRVLAYSPGPPDNPLKGFVPFTGDRRDSFPHSLEWAHFPLNALMTGPGRFDFDRVFNSTVADIAGRGNQAAVRIYLDYPQRPSGVPKFLVENGLRLTPYRDHGGGLSPDYGNDELIQALVDFVTAFGERFDGDPRLGYLTLGLLGFWGEWHTWPRAEFMAPESVRLRLMAAFAKAFSRTPLLMRYPVPDAMNWPIGLHDDSFAHSTIGEDDWELVPRIRAARADDLWKTRPIGGEVRPEVQPHLWKDPAARPSDLEWQDYDECVRQTRATWMICDHLFHKRLPEPEYSRAIAGARRLGYELHLPAVEVPARLDPGTEALVALEIENRGVAPLYAPWAPDLVLLDASGGEIASAPFAGSLDTILPGDPPRRREARLLVPSGAKPLECSLELRPPRAFVGAKPLLFANAETRATDGGMRLVDYGVSGSGDAN